MIFEKNHLPIILVLLVIACATPISPTGGPPDKQGPVLIQSEPVTGTTNFDGKTFHFHFNEYINRNSINNNINVEPDLGLTFSTKWKRKRLSLEFDDKLPDSTTIIISLGGNISDTRNNKMGAPIIVAVSTGDEIDESSITGRVRSANDGTPIEAEKVFLYREPFDLTQKATYQAETDTGGVFRFSYLGPGTYKAIYLDDRNRNKVWDRETELAQSFFVDSIYVDKADTLSLEQIYVDRPDTLFPELQGVGMFSDRRLRLRFNENLELDEDVKIQVLDSLGNVSTEADPLYIDHPDAFILYARSREPLSETATYSLEAEGIADASGNAAITSGILFQGSSQEDTTLQRIISIDTENGLFPTQAFQVTYAAPINTPEIIDSLVVIEGDVDFDDWPNIQTENNILRVFPQGSWIEGVDMQFLIWNPVTQRRSIFRPEVWDLIELGGLELRIENPDSASLYYYQVINEEQNILIDSVMTSSVEIENLAPITYELRIFKDENGNQIWDRGSVEPYRKPEPIYIRSDLNIRTGFTSEVIISF